MRSIRTYLAIWLLGGAGLLIVSAGLVLEVTIARWLEGEFDRALESRAWALATLTEEDQGEVEFEFADKFMPEFKSRTDPYYFELWLDGETLLARSASFEIDEEQSATSLLRDPDLAAATRFADTRLPDGRRGRLVRIDFVPQIDDESDEELPPDDDPSLDSTEVNLGEERHTATVLVARERGTLDGQTSRLRWSLVGFTALLLSTLAALIVGSLKVGLRPLDDLAGQVQGFDAKSLDRRVNLALPSRELAPVVEQLNQLLTRLENAFDRERQLTSDIAHELKTPIAELRNLCEVGSRWPEDSAATRRFFANALAIGLQLESIVVQLLALARYDEGGQDVRVGRVVVSSIVSETWRPLEERAQEKRLTFQNRVQPGAVVETDREMFRVVLSNLLSNAVDHSRPGTAVTVHLDKAGGRSSLTVSNYAAGLDHDDLAVMFDRFWRKDSARAGGRNVGLGLAIVQAFSDLLGFEIETRLQPDNLVQITLSKLR